MRNFIETLNFGAYQNLQTKRIIQFLLREKGKTIPEIRDFCELSLPTTTKFINDLVERDILIESGKKASSGGRRPVVYSLNPHQGYIIGIELLLKSFRLGIINLNHEVVYEYETFDFDISKRDASFDFLSKIVPRLLHQQGIEADKILGVGIGITGRVNSQKGISYTFLNYDKPLIELLQERWQIPVFIDNDSHFMTLGEQRFGSAKGKKNAIHVNLSRGLAVGVISDGKIHNGHSGFAGELGHIPFFDNDKICVCGKTGCLSTIVSGLAMEESYLEKTGQALPYQDIIQLSRQGDKLANALLVEAAEALGKALATLVQVLNPEILVLGGRFIEVGELMKYTIIKTLNLYSLPQLMADCEFQVSILGAKATMLGAYSLVMDEVFR